MLITINAIKESAVIARDVDHSFSGSRDDRICHGRRTSRSKLAITAATNKG